MDAVDSKKIPYDLYIEGETICSTQENSILRNLQSEEDKTGQHYVQLRGFTRPATTAP